MCVSSRTAGMPHFYIYGPNNPDESIRERERQQCCIDVRDYMNGGVRPEWLDDLYRVGETQTEAADGTSVDVVGPFVDADPPNLVWVFDESQDARDARARLMDRLLSQEVSL